MNIDQGRAWPNLEQARAALEHGTGAGVKVAVIDSGIERNHRLWPSYFSSEGQTESGFVLPLADDLIIAPEISEGAGDAYGHGTAVAGVILDEAPEVTLGSFRALNSSNLSSSHIINVAAKQAIALGYHIINCSFGCRGRSKNVLEYKEWIDLAFVHGVHVVAASSNSPEGIREWPSDFSSVIGVRRTKCEPHQFYFQQGEMIPFLAQGENVEVLWKGGGTRTETGSSYAAPRIAGKIARLLSVYPKLEPALVQTILARLAIPWLAGE